MDSKAIVVAAADSTKVQHVNKKSSDELLRKFAEAGSDAGDRRMELKKLMRLAKRRKRITKNSGEYEYSDNNESASGARIRLLVPTATRRSLFLCQLGMGRSHLRNKSFVRTIGKTWRKTMEGASRVLLEKHYNSHKRLINDVV